MPCFPLADAVAGPGVESDGLEVSVVPAFHGGLLSNDSVKRTIRLDLRGHQLPKFDWWTVAEGTLRSTSAAWQVPTLPVSLNPAWRNEPSASCEQIESGVHSWIAGAR